MLFFLFFFKGDSKVFPVILHTLIYFCSWQAACNCLKGYSGNGNTCTYISLCSVVSTFILVKILALGIILLCTCYFWSRDPHFVHGTSLQGHINIYILKEPAEWYTWLPFSYIPVVGRCATTFLDPLKA